ncbi:glycosyltransferase family 2 protein [Geofilum sp. OHC36d9]|uniref:glycosyltransferase family 2 protein n=1 Tax=Geofilum sp. OHC36d9 TaxID=3458413 RepID=UPI004034D6D6
MEYLSVVIITKNNESIIEKCLQSVAWADEIVVIDSGSTDNTIGICNKYKCKVIKSDWLGFGRTKQLAVEHASHNWIFSIDSDEVCTKKLKEEIIQIINNENVVSGYRIKRQTYYLDKPIRYCGWQNDYPLRLFRRDKGTFNSNEIHEFVELEGEIKTIPSLLLHYSFPTISSHFEKMNKYSSLSAKVSFEKNKQSSLLSALLKGSFKFFKMYILQLGFMDGMTGLILSKNSAFGVYMKYIKIYELNKKQHV